MSSSSYVSINGAKQPSITKNARTENRNGPPIISSQYVLQPLPPVIPSPLPSSATAPASSDLQARQYGPGLRPATVVYPVTAGPGSIEIDGNILNSGFHSIPVPSGGVNVSVPSSQPFQSQSGSSTFGLPVISNGRRSGPEYRPTGDVVDDRVRSASSKDLSFAGNNQYLENGQAADEPSDQTSLAAALNSLSIKSIRSSPDASVVNGNINSSDSKDLTSYIYNAGFIHAAWADTFLSIPPHTNLRLHALLASRSPLIYELLSASASQGPPYNIQVNTVDPNISTASVSMTIATLYGQPIVIESQSIEIAKGLIAAGNLFRLDDVAKVGLESLLSQFSVDNLSHLFSFAFEGISRGDNSTITYEQVDLTYPGPYPRYTASLIPSLVNFLIQNLESSFISQPNSDIALRELLVSLPFFLFKHVCESEHLKSDSASQKERHGFARDLIAERERRRRRSGTGNFEEVVVLAFGGGKGGVEVIRKPLGRKKVLWKAGQ
ncbi:hypothetical protein V1514DRAFT_304073 [Lipomyces japonicus]|uniref:uncharacterized protein n=1 Tax=Lipomyces japonicus TaxID=56871 RepID=UPI0034CDDEB6